MRCQVFRLCPLGYGGQAGCKLRAGTHFDNFLVRLRCRKILSGICSNQYNNSLYLFPPKIKISDTCLPPVAQRAKGGTPETSMQK